MNFITGPDTEKQASRFPCPCVSLILKAQSFCGHNVHPIYYKYTAHSAQLHFSGEMRSSNMWQ